MRFFQGILVALVIVLTLTGFRAAPITRSTPIPVATSLTDVRAMLMNFHQHGFNPCVDGLYVNWDATGVNYNGTGTPDPNPCTRHDPLTDLRYLANLYRYQSATGDHVFASDIAKMTPIVLHEYTGHVDARGWVYTELLTISRSDPRFDTIAQRYPAVYAHGYLKASRVDYDFEEASVLVQSGIPADVLLGTHRLNALWAKWYSPKLHLVVWGTEVKTSQEGDIAVALARAGMSLRANDLLTGMHALWDVANGGYDEGATLSPWSLKTKKTGGRQANILILADLLRDTTLAATMRSLIISKVYLPHDAGVVYEQTPIWGLYVIHGHTEDWVTSEAMGITIAALLGT